jgi:hypothetical protein
MSTTKDDYYYDQMLMDRADEETRQQIEERIGLIEDKFLRIIARREKKSAQKELELKNDISKLKRYVEKWNRQQEGARAGGLQNAKNKRVTKEELDQWKMILQADREPSPGGRPLSITAQAKIISEKATRKRSPNTIRRMIPKLI